MLFAFPYQPRTWAFKQQGHKPLPVSVQRFNSIQKMHAWKWAGIDKHLLKKVIIFVG